MKILILSDIQDHGKKCAEGLANRGHDILFVYQKGAVDECVFLNSKIRMKELPYGGKIGYILNALSLNKIFKEYKPDVVHVHYAAGYGLLSRLAGVHPSVISCYGSDIFEFPNQNKLKFFILRNILSNADGLQSTSRGMENEIRKVIGSKNTEIDIIPFGINVELFRPKESRSINSRPVVGFMKSLFPIYNVPLLIRAFKVVLNKTTLNPVLRIYGNGPEKANLQLLVKELGLDDSVFFMGRVPNEEVPNALNEMDVLVNCSEMESFGVNILEAMACGLPVIVTDCVGPKEIVEDGKNGIIVSNRTPEALADAIIRLLSDHDLRRQFSEAGRVRVQNYYNWSYNVIQLENSLNKVLK